MVSTNIAWITEETACVAWYTPPWVPNAAASKTDAGSGAGGTTPMVGAAPAELPAATVVPMTPSCAAAAARLSGSVVTNIKTSRSHSLPMPYECIGAGTAAPLLNMNLIHSGVTHVHINS